MNLLNLLLLMALGLAISSLFGWHLVGAIILLAMLPLLFLWMRTWINMDNNQEKP